MSEHSLQNADQLIKIAETALSKAKGFGADQADAVVSYGTEFEVKVADGKIINLTQATSKSLGLRVISQNRQAVCSTSDFSSTSLRELAERAVGLAKEMEADPHHGIAPSSAGHKDTVQDLELYDPRIVELETSEKIRWAFEIEEAARATDPHITKFRDSGISSGQSQSVLVTSGGSVQTASGTGISAWCTPLAVKENELQTEFWYSSGCQLDDLEPHIFVGQKAANRAARMLGAKAIKSQNATIVFEPRMATGVVGSLISGLDGDLVYKKASFLCDKLGEEICSPLLTVTDDPHQKRKPGSSRYDGEGYTAEKKELLTKGILNTYLYDHYTAKKAGRKSTANGQRGVGGLPYIGCFNLTLAPGSIPEAELLQNSGGTLLITRGLGRGLNPITGDYSRGINGLWFENGELVHAVQEVTIAGNFLEMLQRIDALGSQAHWFGASATPAIRMRDVTISGI